MIPMLAMFLMEEEKRKRSDPGYNPDDDLTDLDFLGSLLWALAAFAVSLAFGILWAAFF